MAKILVVNMNYMGDALMTTPAIALIRAEFPDAIIDTVAGRGAAVDALGRNHMINSVISREAKSSIARCEQLYHILTHGQYTHVYIFPALPAYAITAFLARTKNRIGLISKGMDPFLTIRKSTDSVHLADKLIDTVRTSNSEIVPRTLTLDLTDEDRVAALRLLGNASHLSTRLIAIHMGSTRPQKCWPREKFAELLLLLREYPVVFVGAGDVDFEYAQSISAGSYHSNALNLINQTSVVELAAVLEQAACLVSGDSGPMHLASAVGTPTVALFGSTDPYVTGPYDSTSTVIYRQLTCSPCGNRPTCGGAFTCMHDITAQEVLQAVVRTLSRESCGSEHG